MPDKETSKTNFRGILECPLRKGFIEFEYSLGDRIGDLKFKVQEVWGAPRSGMKQDLRKHGYFWDANAWIICCEAEDGTFLCLRDEDNIPIAPPAAEGDVGESIVDSAARRFQRNWQGLIHTHDLFCHRRINLAFTKSAPDSGDHDVRLLALVAITGG